MNASGNISPRVLAIWPSLTYAGPASSRNNRIRSAIVLSSSCFWLLLNNRLGKESNLSKPLSSIINPSPLLENKTAISLKRLIYLN